MDRNQLEFQRIQSLIQASADSLGLEKVRVELEERTKDWSYFSLIMRGTQNGKHVIARAKSGDAATQVLDAISDAIAKTRTTE